jgi:hypothetical protein
VREAREAWFEAQPDLDPDRLVFLDETAAATNMARRYGRAPRGERCRIAVPQGHYKTTTVTAALRSTGLVATALFDGATNGQRFRSYVTETLVPVLKRGNTVILDNLPAHKVAGVRQAVEAAGARLLYLPPYSPDFNPIELPSSRRCCAQRPLAPFRICARPSGKPSPASRPGSAATTSPLLDTRATRPLLHERAPL